MSDELKKLKAIKTYVDTYVNMIEEKRSDDMSPEEQSELAEVDEILGRQNFMKLDNLVNEII